MFNLTVSDHRRVVRLIEEYILATDLSRYFARIPVFKRTLEARSGSVQPGSMEPWSTNQTERNLLGCMLMTTCDISAITKPWPVQKLVSFCTYILFSGNGVWAKGIKLDAR